MNVRAEEADELAHVMDVVVEVERPFRDRHHPGIGPVGDEDLVVAEQALDGVAQQRRMVTRQRGDQQHFRLLELGELLVGQVFLEMQQAAKGALDDDFLDDADSFAGDRGVDDVKF